jgi:uncharacterized membrane protein YgdD (TMEM256/DUF423 family)
MQNWALILVTLAGLAGAMGIGEAAAVAHVSIEPQLQIASNFLIVHAAACLAMVALALHVQAGKTIFLIASTALLLGLALFCGDLTVHALSNTRLFPMAAPIGGSLLILGWVIAAAAGLTGLFQKRP